MVFFLALVLATEGFLVASLVARQSGGSFLAAIIQSEIISMTNQERADNQVGMLMENKLLDAAAQAKADDMAAKGYFAHQSPDGRQPWDFITAAGYDYQYAGENLAVRFVDSKDVVNAWMASPEHRANIVKAQYTNIGVGIAEGTYKGAPATFVVQYFGNPAPTVVPAPTPKVAERPSAAPAPAPTGQVLGTAATPTPAPSNLINDATKQLPRLAAEPRSSAAWILGGIATLLILLIGLTFIARVQVQPTDLLLPGMVAAGIAVFFIVFNSAFLGAASSQAASAIGAGSSGVVLPADAAATVR